MKFFFFLLFVYCKNLNVSENIEFIFPFVEEFLKRLDFLPIILCVVQLLNNAARKAVRHLENGSAIILNYTKSDFKPCKWCQL